MDPVLEGGRGRGMNWETGIDIHTLLCITHIANENLLYISGNCTQLSVVTSMGRKSKNEEIYTHIHTHTHTHIADSIFCIAETNMAL